MVQEMSPPMHFSDYPFVSVIIPVYNDPGRLPKCLSALEQQASYPSDRYEIIVVDNGSDESIEPLVRPFAHVQAALENVPLWHERDISHSSVERIILPDSTILLHYLLGTACRVLEGLEVHPDAMRANLERTGGLVYSGTVLLALARAGVTREDAYSLVQRNAMQAWDTGADFRSLQTVRGGAIGQEPGPRSTRPAEVSLADRRIDADENGTRG